MSLLSLTCQKRTKYLKNRRFRECKCQYINHLQPSSAVSFNPAALNSQKGAWSGFNRYKAELWRLHHHVTCCVHLHNSLCTEGFGSAHPCHWRRYAGNGQTNYDKLYQPYRQIPVCACVFVLGLPSLNKTELGFVDRSAWEKVIKKLCSTAVQCWFWNLSLIFAR